MRLLFVKEHLAWPRSSGHDVHCYHMMQALARLGHDVSPATTRPATAEAVAGAGLSATYHMTGRVGADAPAMRLTKMQERFRRYWGVDENVVREVGGLARDRAADAVVVVGLNVLPYLGAVERSLRVWYAGDEWFWHHWSQTRFLRPSTWGELKVGLLKGLYERNYAPLLDRTWVVSAADRRAMHWVAGAKNVDILPNGVDADHYHPGTEPEHERSCVFWGRLDFGPNIQALEWFCRRVWPAVRCQFPDARFSIYGFQPGGPVRELASAPGIQLHPDLPDIRAEVRRHQVVVLPFVSGGGIKNKLLEAAALGKAILCTPRTCRGLAAGDPVVRRASAGGWVQGLGGLWGDAACRARLGSRARDWVTKHHTWAAVARTAVKGLMGTSVSGSGR